MYLRHAILKRVVCCYRQVAGTWLKVSALRRNWFSQPQFHSSHQLTTVLSINMMKHPEYGLYHFENFINSSMVHNNCFSDPMKNPPITF